MHNQQQQAGWTPIEDTKNLSYVLLFAARAIASPVEPILRRKFGTRYFGWATAVGFFAPPLWMMFWPGEDPSGIFVFWLIFLLMQLSARIESARMAAKGQYIHSRYNGWPRLARFFKTMPEQRIKAGPEPLFVFIAGAALMSVTAPLGSYLMVAAFSLFAMHAVADAVERAQAVEMNDALIEQQNVAERFRQMQNGRN